MRDAMIAKSRSHADSEIASTIPASRNLASVFEALKRQLADDAAARARRGADAPTTGAPEHPGREPEPPERPLHHRSHQNEPYRLCRRVYSERG